jgi:hypothetical protein
MLKIKKYGVKNEKTKKYRMENCSHNRAGLCCLFCNKNNTRVYVMSKKEVINTPYVAEMLGVTIHTVLKCGKHIGISYKNGQSMIYTEEQIEKIRVLAPKLVKTCRKNPEPKKMPMNYTNPEWWINPIPDCLLDEEDEEKHEEIID